MVIAMTGRMVLREMYLSRLREMRGLFSVAKVIMGIRRCGKSTLLGQYISELLESGVPESDIISIDFNEPSNQHLHDIKALNAHLLEVIPTDHPSYLFLDEVQLVKGWERTVAGLCDRGNVDIYITGSNGHLLSNELTTMITGRYVEIPMLPPSFHEFVALYEDEADRNKLLDMYLHDGTVLLTDPFMYPTTRTDLLKGLSDSIIVEDISSRESTPNPNTTRKIARFLFSNIGNETSISKIAEGIGSSSPTVEKYIDALLAAGLFMYAEKYDIVGSKLLRTNGKYYATDMGLRRVNLNQHELKDLSRPIENLVFLELIRRGYEVCVGSYRGREIDFQATRGDTTEYFQVCQTMLSEDTREREFRSLDDMKNSIPKTIITGDAIGLGNFGGIRVVNLIDWLLDDGTTPRVVPAPTSWRIGRISIANDRACHRNK
ncbi:MAG: ATP-binding protein [Thermoplasmata archaeon]|nr:ATP-binding protein [Thermoplasmata archaeon]